MTLTTADATSSLVRGGFAGLPDVSSTILIQAGSGSLIARDGLLPCGSNEPTAFRILNVMGTGALTLQGVTLRNGCVSRASGAGVAGGAIDVEGGSLTLTDSRVERHGQGRRRAGGNGSPGFGGA